MTGDDLVIVIPVWRRTTNIARVYRSAISATDDANVLFVVSVDDVACRNALEGYELDHLLVGGAGGDTGDYARKINIGYQETTEPFIFTGADDLDFADDWYERARSWMVDDIGVVGTNDECNARTYSPGHDGFPHSTHSLVARWYADLGGSVDRDHAIYHEGYVHEYCDDELVQVAILRNAYAHALDATVRHLHPNNGTADDDETYRHGRSRTRVSRNLYQVRRRLWDPMVGMPGVTQVRR